MSNIIDAFNDLLLLQYNILPYLDDISLLNLHSTKKKYYKERNPLIRDATIKVKLDKNKHDHLIKLISEKKIETFKKLVSVNDQVIDLEPYYGWGCRYNLLGIACLAKSYDIFKFILSKRSSYNFINKQSIGKHTVLHESLKIGGQYSNLLLLHNADPKIKDQYGYSYRDYMTGSRSIWFSRNAPP
jgi:hypothetical protein